MPARNSAPAQTMPVRAWYSLQRWRTRAKHQLRVEPLCRLCKAKGLVVPATNADHFPAHGGDYNAPSFAARSDRFASLVTTACNRASNTEAIGPTLASTAIRSIQNTRGIAGGRGRRAGSCPRVSLSSRPSRPGSKAWPPLRAGAGYPALSFFGPLVSLAFSPSAAEYSAPRSSLTVPSSTPSALATFRRDTGLRASRCEDQDTPPPGAPPQSACCDGECGLTQTKEIRATRGGQAPNADLKEEKAAAYALGVLSEINAEAASGKISETIDIAIWNSPRNCAIFQLRHICELIAIGCLIIQGDYASSSDDYSPSKNLSRPLKNHMKDFFPQLVSIYNLQ